MATVSSTRVTGNGHRKGPAIVTQLLKAAPIPAAELAVAIAKRLPVASLEPGEYRVQGTVTLAVDAIITKGQPTSAKQSYNLDLATVLAVALERAGIKVEKIPDFLEKTITIALENGPTQLYAEVTQAMIKQTETAVAENLPRVPRQSATHVAGTVEIVHFNAK
ncbi:MAG TPA: hypothetical protein VK395_07610 [Gemmataceae bacterium]|nr:hypothetical protein [Gemmataceae bacterium]